MTERESGGPAIGLRAYLAVSSLVNLATWVLLLLPNFLQQRGWSSQEIGWAVGAYFSVNLVSQLLAGEMADRRGSMKTALTGVGLGVCAGFCYVLAHFWTWLVIPGRILHGAGTGLVSAGVLIQLTESVPLNRKGQVIGYFGLPGFVMIGLGPSLSEWLYYVWGYEASFVLVLAAFAGMAWLVVKLPRSLIGSSRPRPGFSVVFRASFVRLETILAFSVFFGLCGSAWNGFLAPAVRDLGAGAVSAFGFGYAAGAVMTRLGFSHRLDSQARRLFGIGTLLPYALGLALIPHAFAPWNLLLLGLVCGMGHGIYYPSLSSLAAERFHPLYPGQGMSLYVSASALGYFVGPPLWGALIDEFGYGLVFALAGGLLALSTTVFLMGESRRKPSDGLH